MTEVSEDRLAGALAFAALGDAAGWDHEPEGLAGRIGDPDRPLLPPVEKTRERKANPWNIWAPRRLTRGLRGVVSDDTAVRLCLIEPWLAMGETRNETSFRRFFVERPPLARPWAEHTAGRMALALRRAYRATEKGKVSGFVIPGQPANWGPFLFGTLALVGSMPECALDQGAGRATSQAFARLVAEGGIDTASLDRVVLGIEEAGVRERSLQALELGSRPASASRFLESLQGWSLSLEVWPFDPLRQWGEVLAVLAYGNGDPETILRAGVSIAGDSDTVASHCGLIAGGALGRSELGALGAELDTVEATTLRMFGVTTASRAGGYLAASRKPIS